MGLPSSVVSLGSKGTITPLTPDDVLQCIRLWPPTQSPQSATQYPAQTQYIFFLVCLHWIYLYGCFLFISSSTRSPLQYFGPLMGRTDSLEKILMLGKIEGRKRRGRQRTRWLDGIINSMDMNLSKALGVGDGQGSLACCSPWGCKE